MDSFTVIKNALVLTLDRKKQSGYFNIIVKNGKVFLIDYERKFNEKEFISKNPDAKIIDARNKLVMPGLFNSRLVTSYSLSRLFFKRCNYENIGSMLSLKLIDRYLSENQEAFSRLYRFNYQKSILCGEIFVNESSPSISKSNYEKHISDNKWYGGYYQVTAYDQALSGESNSKPAIGFQLTEDLNNYTISNLKKLLQGSTHKLIIDASLSKNTFESTKKTFGKPLVNVLRDADLINANTIITNPTHLSYGELEILVSKEATLLISPTDYLMLSGARVNIEELFKSGIRIILGTGMTGRSILSELKTLSVMMPMSLFTFEELLRTAIGSPSIVFGISNLTGSIEKNKSADFTLFDISTQNNSLTLPDPDIQNICEFVISCLTPAEVTDVFVKGEHVVENGNLKTTDSRVEYNDAKDVSEKLYAAGKYFEFKEKYLMRGRVDKLSLGSSEDEEAEPEVFVDMTVSEEYLGEGEFTIVGTKEEDFQKPRGRDEDTTEKVSLKEVKSLDSELNLFDEKEFQKEDSLKKRTKVKTSVSKQSPKEKAVEEEIVPEIENEKTEETKITEVKKSRLKFGFGDDT